MAKGKDLKTAKGKKKSHIQGKPHKTISWFSAATAGQKGVV